jgi:Homeodomain-like domain
MGIGAGAAAGGDPAGTRPGADGRASSPPYGCSLQDGAGHRSAYEEEGLESAWYEKPRPGQRRVLDAGQSQRIIALVCGPPPEGRAGWSVRLIAQEAVKRKWARRVGRETIRILLQSHDLKPWREKNVVRGGTGPGVSAAHGRRAGLVGEAALRGGTGGWYR